MGITDEFKETWPRAGLMCGGIAYRLPPLAPITRGTGSGLWPTPRVTCLWGQAKATATHGWDLPAAVKDSLEAKPSRVWPTPTTKDDRPTSRASRERYGAGPTLGQAVREREMLPTPLATDAEKMHTNGLSRLLKTGSRKGRMNPGNGGQLNPDWQDWLMGWPPGWSGLEPLDRGRFRLWLRLHGGCWREI
jgi:hypothetical protein